MYAELREMSEYYQLLKGSGKERCVKKLHLLGFTEMENYSKEQMENYSKEQSKGL